MGFEVFRPDLSQAMAYSDGRKDGRLTQAGAIDGLFNRFDATLVAAPKNSAIPTRRREIFGPDESQQDWQDKPEKLYDGKIPSTDLSIPFFGYKPKIRL